MGCAGGKGGEGLALGSRQCVEMTMWPLPRLTQPWHTKQLSHAESLATLRCRQGGEFGESDAVVQVVSGVRRTQVARRRGRGISLGFWFPLGRL
jgi:hypothetical protein